MADYLAQMWENISGNSDIYTWNPFPASLFSYPALTDPTPLRHLLESVYDDHNDTQAQRNISIGITSFDNGEHYEVDETNDLPDLVEATMCSSADVPVFPYQNWRNSTYVDGGFTMGYDPFVAISRCRELVDDDSQIILDVFFLGGQIPLGKASKPKSAFEALDRGKEIYAY
jgi:predicted acylesterase/phospholipase RssA